MSDWGNRAFLITSALSVARELWRHDEPELAERALKLTPDEVLDLGIRAMQLIESGDDKRVWPGGHSSAGLVLAAIEVLEGAPRPPRRRRRIPEKSLPNHLQATLMERHEAARPVDAAMHARLAQREARDIHER